MRIAHMWGRREPRTNPWRRYKYKRKRTLLLSLAVAVVVAHIEYRLSRWRGLVVLLLSPFAPRSRVSFVVGFAMAVHLHLGLQRDGLLRGAVLLRKRDAMARSALSSSEVEAQPHGERDQDDDEGDRAGVVVCYAYGRRQSRQRGWKRSNAHLPIERRPPPERRKPYLWGIQRWKGWSHPRGQHLQHYSPTGLQCQEWRPD